MAKLKARINKDEYLALGDVLHEFYAETAEGDYVLEADGVEDVSGLKSALKREKEEKRDAKEQLKQFEGLDPDQARKALEATQKIEEKKLIDKQQFDEVLKKYRSEFDAELEKEKSKNAQLLTNLKREKLTNLVVDKGVLSDRARFALVELLDQVEILSDENGIHLQKKGGIGDPKEIDEMVTGLKENSAFLFAPTNASGSGATQSERSTGYQNAANLTPREMIAAALAETTT